MILEQARRVLEIEASALRQLADDLGESFEQAVAELHQTTGRVILTGIGKSGIICRKIAATFASTGTPAFFVHPAEAIHGDLGMIVDGDTVIAVSNSGETEELVRLLAFIKRQAAMLIAITGKPASTLAKHANIALCYHLDQEGCPLNLAPMASTTVTLALGDALAAAVMDAKGFTSREFANFHPGGKLGKRLMTVADAMARQEGDTPPLVQHDTPLAEALVEISQKRLGTTAVILPDGAIGVISDGDVRRLLQKHGPGVLELTAGEVCTRAPKTISAQRLAVEALQLMEKNHITALLVLDQQERYCGVIHLHDLWKTQMV